VRIKRRVLGPVLMSVRMTSAALRARFESDYNEFFSGPTTIVSCPANCWIVGEHATLRGSLGAKQNLPLRIYCAISPTSDGALHICRDMPVYLPSKAGFEIHRLPDRTCDELERAIGPVCTQWLNGPISGAEIRFLSEAPVASGIGVSGAMASAFLLAFAIHQEAFTAADVAGIASEAPSLHRSAGPRFDQIFRMAWYIDSLLQEGVSSGAASLCALMASPVPIVYGFEAPTPRTRQEFATKPYVAFSLENIFKSSDAARWNWPITFALVYSGSRRPTGAIVRGSAWIKKRTNRISSFWQNVFKDALLGHPRPTMLSMTGTQMWQYYMDTLAILSADTIKLLADLFEQGAQPHEFDRFLRNISLYQQALAYMELSTPVIDRLVAHAATARAVGGVPLAVKVTGAGAGGDVVLFAPRGNATAIEELVKEVNREGDAAVVLDYFEERDGLEPAGPRVEAALEPIRGALYAVTIWDQGKMEQTIVDGRGLATAVSRCQLVLDRIDTSVFVCGRRLLAGQIKSRKMTVLVIPRLLHSLNQFVTSHQLRMDAPETDYIESRGELNATVLTPLNHALEISIGTGLDLKFRGKASDFEVKLATPSFIVAVVERPE
jgi:mevalonate kinase